MPESRNEIITKMNVAYPSYNFVSTIDADYSD